MIRFKIGGAIAALLLSVAASQATPITINYTLNPTSGGSVVGNMELVLSSIPTSTQPVNYNSLISAGSKVTFGTEVFALTSSNVTLLEFNNLSPNYSLYIVSLPYIHDTNGAGWLTMSSSFAYQSANGGLNEAGGFSNGVVAAPAAVPEPLTLSLFSAGLFGAAVLRRRQKKKPTAV